MLGFDAIGRLSLGQVRRGNISMPAVAGSFTVSGVSQALKISEATSAGSFALTGTAITEIIGVGTGSFALSGAAQKFKFVENVSAGSYILTGSATDNVSERADPGSFVLTGADVPLFWTGAGVDTSYTGGIGHYLEEIERRKQLSAITRKIPAPIDRRTMPRFAPIPAAQPMPAPPTAAQLQAPPPDPARAAAARRRRDEEAVLLLAS